MDQSQNQVETDRGYLFLPAITGGGVIVHHSQIVGARPNGPDQGAIIYTQAGPSIYTSLTTTDLAEVLNAGRIDPRR